MIRKTLHRFITLVLAGFLLAISGECWTSQTLAQIPPHVFYVAPNGSDTNNGSLEHPWSTINHAAGVLKAGETVYIRGGNYRLTEQIQAKNSGTEKAWITYRSYPEERVIIDADAVKVEPPSGKKSHYPHDQGAFLLQNVSYIKVENLEVINSHNSGITVRNSHFINLYNNKTENTFSPGIGVWWGDHYKVMGNTVINANDLKMADFLNDFPEAPHEAISIGGVENFEVAYNLVKDGKKEGIDVKEKSKYGTVHHNYIHHMARQGLYVDSWFGVLEDVEVFNNVVHDCNGAGFALAVEGGAEAKNIRFHHNLIYDNWGTGILFARWGNDGLRHNIKVYNNTVHHNGYGKPNLGESFFWITGGLYLFSDNLQNVEIKNNIFSKNRGFQIGYSDRYLAANSDIEKIFRQKDIEISQNLIFGENNTSRPIYAGWLPDNYANIYGTNGTAAVREEPQFVNPEEGNFYLKSPVSNPTPLTANSKTSQMRVGAFPNGEKPHFWWQGKFPPQFPDLPQ